MILRMALTDNTNSNDANLLIEGIQSMPTANPIDFNSCFEVPIVSNSANDG